MVDFPWTHYGRIYSPVIFTKDNSPEVKQGGRKPSNIRRARRVKKLIDLPREQINDCQGLVGETLYSSVLNFLPFLPATPLSWSQTPEGFFEADTAPFKGPQLQRYKDSGGGSYKAWRSQGSVKNNDFLFVEQCFNC